jgi:hypothetical protein
MCFLFPSLFGEEGLRSLIRPFKDDRLAGREIVASLHRMFRVEVDEFWAHHYRFDQHPSREGVSLGVGRANDLILNCCVPIVLLYARVFKDQTIRGNALKTLRAMPPLQGNSITRMLQRQLLKNRLQWRSALEQQGGIQLFKFFCAPGRCSACEVGEHVGLKDS